jgi:hypothetical protein
MTMDSGVHLPLIVSAILVLYNVTCYIYMRNFANFCILVWIHMDAHEYVFFFQNLNILCIFSDRFFDPVSVFWVDRFNDRFGSGNLALDVFQGILARAWIDPWLCTWVDKTLVVI